MRHILLGKDPQTGHEVYLGHRIHKRITKHRLFSTPEFVWVIDNTITVKTHRDALRKIERMVENE
jgi:hypothetical protein